MNNKTNIAWAAGLYEGEGSCVASKRKSRPNSPSISMRLTSCDKDVIEKFHSIVQVGNQQTPHIPNNGLAKKVQYIWACNNHSDIEKIINLFLPYLSERRTKQVNVVLDYIKSRKPPQSCGYDIGKPTRYGAQKHRNKGEPVCVTCLELQTEYEKQRKAS